MDMFDPNSYIKMSDDALLDLRERFARWRSNAIENVGPGSAEFRMASEAYDLVVAEMRFRGIQ